MDLLENVGMSSIIYGCSLTHIVNVRVQLVDPLDRRLCRFVAVKRVNEI